MDEFKQNEIHLLYHECYTAHIDVVIVQHCNCRGDQLPMCILCFNAV